MENGQVKMSSLDHLDYCCKLVGELYGKPELSTWTNGDFIRLGYILYKKTNVQISPNTLKRIFGKIKTDVRYYPQRATRDALARYIGYADWEKFIGTVIVPVTVAKNFPHIPAQSEPTDEPVTTAASTRSKLNKWRIVSLVILIIAVSGFFIYKAFYIQSPIEDAKLICKNPIGGNPHSAAFVVHGLPANTESKAHYSIDFGDSRKISLTAGDSLYSHYYEVPGRYWATLKRDGVTVDSASVYLQTNGWTTTAEMMYDTTRVYPINVKNLVKGGQKSVTASEVFGAGVDTNRTFFVKFINTQLTGISGDNFDLFMKLNTSADRPGVRCSQVRVTVFGESSKHLFDVMKPGCTHWTDIQFSEIEKPGELNQLSFLGEDLHEGGSLQLKVVDQKASVFINSKQVYQTEYQKPLKQIYGLGITFSGIGAIHAVILKDLKTGKLFDGNFQ